MENGSYRLRMFKSRNDRKLDTRNSTQKSEGRKEKRTEKFNRYRNITGALEESDEEEKIVGKYQYIVNIFDSSLTTKQCHSVISPTDGEETTV